MSKTGGIPQVLPKAQPPIMNMVQVVETKETWLYSPDLKVKDRPHTASTNIGYLNPMNPNLITTIEIGYVCLMQNLRNLGSMNLQVADSTIILHPQYQTHQTPMNFEEVTPLYSCTESDLNFAWQNYEQLMEQQIGSVSHGDLKLYTCRLMIDPENPIVMYTEIHVNPDPLQSSTQPVPPRPSDKIDWSAPHLVWIIQTQVVAPVAPGDEGQYVPNMSLGCTNTSQGLTNWFVSHLQVILRNKTISVKNEDLIAMQNSMGLATPRPQVLQKVYANYTSAKPQGNDAGPKIMPSADQCLTFLPRFLVQTNITSLYFNPGLPQYYHKILPRVPTMLTQMWYNVDYTVPGQTFMLSAMKVPDAFGANKYRDMQTRHLVVGETVPPALMGVKPVVLSDPVSIKEESGEEALDDDELLQQQQNAQVQLQLQQQKQLKINNAVKTQTAQQNSRLIPQGPRYNDE